MLQQGSSFRQEIDGKAFSFKSLLEISVKGPFLHWPDRTGFGRDCHVTSQAGLNWVRQEVLLSPERESKPVEDDILICTPIQQLKPVRLGTSEPADEAQ